jgi:hypothetical protein
MISRTFAVIAACLFLATRGSAQSFDYTLIDVPCSTDAPTSCPNGVAVQTAVNGINADGDIVGTYTDGVRRQHGFLRKGTQYFTIDVPGRLIGATGTLPTSAMVSTRQVTSSALSRRPSMRMPRSIRQHTVRQRIRQPVSRVFCSTTAASH